MSADSAALRSGFLRSAERFPTRTALRVEGVAWSYASLRERAASLAATLLREAPSDAPPLTAVMAYRSATAFAGVLGALFQGHGYVPLNPTYPAERTRQMLERAGWVAMVVDPASEAHLEEVLAGVERPLVVLLPDRDDAGDLVARWPRHRFVSGAQLEPASAWRPEGVAPEAVAYLLFTSGSTGIPKGVSVTNANVRHFVDAMVERYEVTANDRFSQMFDMTFDLSAFDMFVAWERGACLCCPTHKQKLLPSAYLRDEELTIWFSVPSTAVVLQRLRKLEAGAYPGLRLALFCGEALPVEVAEAWSRAAPNARIENLYGPTEATIACTGYAWDPETSPTECEGGLVPIGEPLPGMKALVCDGSLHEVEPGEAGELLMSGPQLCPGYWQDSERTAAAFVLPPGRDAIHYRTGDRVRRPRDGGPLAYLGRTDGQIKIQGYRVELGEVEAVLRELSGASVAVALGWPRTPSGADGVVAFLGSAVADPGALRERLKQRLPPYMIPREIRVVSEFPLNPNGKVDRKALLRMIETEA